MKKNRKEKTEEPFAVKVKTDELKIAQKELHEYYRTAQIKELFRSQDRLINVAKQDWHALNKATTFPLSIKINRPHSRGDFFGKFHPSKSNKGIKRSAP
jgi:maltodextrin utilization protein YvdJ